MNPTVNSSSIPLAANAVNTINASGSFIIFTSNTGPFQFSFDGGSWQDGYAILAIDLYREQAMASPLVVPISVFKKVLLRDTSGAANTVRYVISNSPVGYLNPNATYFQKQAPTYSKGADPLVIPAGGASALFSGADAGGNARHQFVATNLDAALLLKVLDGNGKIMGTIFPLSSVTLLTNGALQIKNPNGADINGEVGETFYS